MREDSGWGWGVIAVPLCECHYPSFEMLELASISPFLEVVYSNSRKTFGTSHR